MLNFLPCGGFPRSHYNHGIARYIPVSVLFCLFVCFSVVVVVVLFALFFCFFGLCFVLLFCLLMLLFFFNT